MKRESIRGMLSKSPFFQNVFRDLKKNDTDLRVFKSGQKKKITFKEILHLSSQSKLAAELKVSSASQTPILTATAAAVRQKLYTAISIYSITQ